jgi:glycosyltransferase involved in cell wall biosynthesis
LTVRILHAIHDFLPRHQAGSEIYAFDLCQALSARHHVTIVCADYDPARIHGAVRWRVCGGLPVAEIVNNWRCASFEDSYRSPAITARIAELMRAVQPDVLHVHSLMNLSFDLPAQARARGIPVVATLHDYTLVCPSGGQRVHRADAHLCRTIDSDRCARCFQESAVYEQVSFARLARATGAPALLRRVAVAAARRAPSMTARARRAARRLSIAVDRADIEARLEHARRACDCVDLFVAPSPSIAAEFERFGVPAAKIRVADYGFKPFDAALRGKEPARPLRNGYVGTLVWHKGVHVVVDAVRALPTDAYELRIFGNPATFPDYVARLRSDAAGLPVRFMGAFPRERLGDVYGQIDVLVVPSLWLENSPLAIHEAFMAGVPVVASRIGGIENLIDDGYNGLLFEPSDAAALAALLGGIIEDPSCLRSLAAAAPRVRTIDQDARDWEAIYAGFSCLAPAAAPVS